MAYSQQSSRFGAFDSEPRTPSIRLIPASPPQSTSYYPESEYAYSESTVHARPRPYGIPESEAEERRRSGGYGGFGMDGRSSGYADDIDVGAAAYGERKRRSFGVFFNELQQKLSRLARPPPRYPHGQVETADGPPLPQNSLSHQEMQQAQLPQDNIDVQAKDTGDDDDYISPDPLARLIASFRTFSSLPWITPNSFSSRGERAPITEPYIPEISSARSHVRLARFAARAREGSGSGGSTGVGGGTDGVAGVSGTSEYEGRGRRFGLRYGREAEEEGVALKGQSWYRPTAFQVMKTTRREMRKSLRRHERELKRSNTGNATHVRSNTVSSSGHGGVPVMMMTAAGTTFSPVPPSSSAGHHRRDTTSSTRQTQPITAAPIAVPVMVPYTYPYTYPYSYPGQVPASVPVGPTSSQPISGPILPAIPPPALTSHGTPRSAPEIPVVPPSI